MASRRETRVAKGPTMSTSTITRSPGLAVGSFVVGGGRAISPELDALVLEAAAQLGATFDGAPVTIRYNTGGASGGAWLQTSAQDAIGRNAEVGITAWQSPETSDLHLSVRISPVATGSDPIYESADTVEAAVETILAHAPATFDALVETIAAAEARFRDDHVRLGLSAVRSDGAYFVFADNDDDGRALLASVARSTSTVNAPFSRYAIPATFVVKGGRVQPRGGAGAVGAHGVPWSNAHDFEANTVYRMTDGGSTVEALGVAVKRRRP